MYVLGTLTRVLILVWQVHHHHEPTQHLTLDNKLSHNYIGHCLCVSSLPKLFCIVVVAAAAAVVLLCFVLFCH